MKVLVQRVLSSSVEVDNKIVGQINKGLMLLVGFTDSDTDKEIDYMVDKIINLRIFDDENGVMNKSLIDGNGSILSISQFTLYADCKKSGNRPSFSDAAKPDIAVSLYEYFVNECKKQVPIVQTGIFGADMKVTLLNDGPVTIIMDSE